MAGKYPGMRVPEGLIWDAWLASHPALYPRIQYNVPVGRGSDPGAGVEPTLRQMHIRNSQRKIDVVLHHPDGHTIVEVKERAQLGSVGQLIGYQHLWQQDNPGKASPRMLLLTARLSPGVKEVAEKYGIEVGVVAADFSSITGAV